MKKISNQAFSTIVITAIIIIALALTVKVVLWPSLFEDDRLAMPMFDRDVAVSSSGIAVGMPMGEEMASYNLIDAKTTMFWPEPTPSGGLTAAEADQRIIKSADLSITVSGVETKVAEIVSLATGRGGYVQSSTVIEDEDGNKTGFVTVRVPVEEFEGAISAIKDLAEHVEREFTTGQDVTEQYTDLEARLRSATAQEEQYLLILEKAETVQDILAVQSYLQSIRYEIESLTGQLQSLGNQTNYSTISVSISEEVRIEVPTAKFDLLRDLKEAMRYVVLLAQTGLTFLVWFVVIGVAVALPIGLIISLVVWVIRKFVK